MSEQRRALVLHLTSGSDPLLVAIPPQDAAELAARLPDMIRRADVETITAANGSAIAVNFGHVLAAHVDATPGTGQIYGGVRATSHAFSVDR
jgi:hypothetical protein